MITYVERTRRQDISDAAVAVSLVPCILCGSALLEERDVHALCFKNQEIQRELAARSAMDLLRIEVEGLRAEVARLREAGNTITYPYPLTITPSTTAAPNFTYPNYITTVGTSTVPYKTALPSGAGAYDAMSVTYKLSYSSESPDGT